MPVPGISEAGGGMSPQDLMKQIMILSKASQPPTTAAPSGPNIPQGSDARIGGPPPSIMPPMPGAVPQAAQSMGSQGVQGSAGPGSVLPQPAGFQTGFNFPNKAARNAAVVEGTIQNMGQAVAGLKQQAFNKKKQQASGLTAQMISAQQVIQDPNASPESKKMAQQVMQQIMQGKNSQKTAKMLEKMQDPTSAEYAGMMDAYNNAKKQAAQNQQQELQQAQAKAMLDVLQGRGGFRLGPGGKLESNTASPDEQMRSQTEKEVEAARAQNAKEVEQMRIEAERAKEEAAKTGSIRDEKTGAVPSLDYHDGKKWNTFGYKSDMSQYPKDVSTKLQADHDNWMATQDELDKREQKRESAAERRQQSRQELQENKLYTSITKPARSAFDLYRDADKAASKGDDFAVATAYLQATTGTATSRGASSKMLDEAVASGRGRFTDIALKVRQGGVKLIPEQRNGMVDDIKDVYTTKRSTAISNLKDAKVYREPDNLPDFGAQGAPTSDSGSQDPFAGFGGKARPKTP